MKPHNFTSRGSEFFFEHIIKSSGRPQRTGSIINENFQNL